MSSRISSDMPAFHRTSSSTPKDQISKNASLSGSPPSNNIATELPHAPNRASSDKKTMLLKKDRYYIHESWRDIGHTPTFEKRSIKMTSKGKKDE